MPTLYPSWYSRTLLPIDELFARHHVEKMHPEFARRLRLWLEAQDGNIGIGGSWRATGSQPSKPGFAPEGKSFHQYQTFASGLTAFCAVDLVARNGANIHRAPSWSEVPAQGSAEAAKWGVHCNIASESWHMQPIEIDGWQSWVNDGRPAPIPNYGLTVVQPEPLPEDPDMAAPEFFKTSPTSPTVWQSTDGITAVHVTGPQYLALGAPAVAVKSKAAASKYSYVQSLQHDFLGLA